MAERLVDLLDALHAERLETWEPAQLRHNIDQRRINVEQFDPIGAPQVDEPIAPFELVDVEGGVVRSRDLVQRGAAVLVFFRHESCPACNIALPYYDRNLWPTLSSLGVPLVAISPQVPEALINVRRRHGFTFHVASDPGARLGRRFGLIFKSLNEPSPTAVAQGIGEMTNPAIVVIDADHRVRFIDVTPDWMARTEAGPVIEAVDKVLEDRLEPAGAWSSRPSAASSPLQLPFGGRGEADRSDVGTARRPGHRRFPPWRASTAIPAAACRHSGCGETGRADLAVRPGPASGVGNDLCSRRARTARSCAHPSKRRGARTGFGRGAMGGNPRRSVRRLRSRIGRSERRG